jgi:hypothetical protein
MHQYNAGAPFEQIAVDVAGPFPPSDTKRPEAYTIPNQEVSMVAEALVSNLYRMSYVVTSAVTSRPV